MGFKEFLKKGPFRSQKAVKSFCCETLLEIRDEEKYQIGKSWVINILGNCSLLCTINNIMLPVIINGIAKLLAVLPVPSTHHLLLHPIPPPFQCHTSFQAK
jgi:hypothetical protein